MHGIISRNLKAVEAGIGSILMVLTFVASFEGALPQAWAGGITAVLGVLTTFRVWLARNEPLISQAEDAVDELVDKTVGAFQIRG
ncbi:hypothetical protein [Nocardia arthritidis]|uniref:Holin n=1 Tax=Nocardia arthritidis TaxID=228602 RepID=A0A6G9YU30_9NOCA|nr:hypothetical protein [Nocardia arthritidis]QIS16506.1 hypothetical protein F5544_43510 [Nocardia arthritidis]